MHQHKDTIIEQFICNENTPFPLSQEQIKKALMQKGEQQLLKLTYEDLHKEYQEKKLLSKLLEPLAILVVFENDGIHTQEIEEFTRYLHQHTQPTQYLQFGVKNTQELCDAPIKILFTGILPINQFEIALGEALYTHIQTHQKELKPLFTHLRETLSNELNITLLPVKQYKKETLSPYGLELIDPYNNTLLYKEDIGITDSNPQEIIIYYMQKIYALYKHIGKKYAHSN